MLWCPEAGPEVSAVGDITVVKKQMVERPSQGTFRAWAEAVHDEGKVLC